MTMDLGGLARDLNRWQMHEHHKRRPDPYQPWGRVPFTGVPIRMDAWPEYRARTDQLDTFYRDRRGSLDKATEGMTRFQKDLFIKLSYVEAYDRDPGVRKSANELKNFLVWAVREAKNGPSFALAPEVRRSGFQEQADLVSGAMNTIAQFLHGYFGGRAFQRR